MPRKKVNDNIISVRMQNIRLRGEITAVNRRTGGLEIKPAELHRPANVNRRIGGLEISHLARAYAELVNRRIGGLEKGIR